MSTTAHLTTPTRCSVIAAVYNVSRYLDDFIDAIEGQTLPADQLEVIMVDDGSTDESLVRLKRWQEARPELVTVVSKENGGQASARNVGMQHATGDWITFLDPDDWVNDRYFEIVARFADANPDVEMIATHRVFYEEGGAGIRDGHPLRRMFRSDQLVDLNAFPEYFHGSAPAAFVRRDRIINLNLRFDERIRPNFEDGHFCARYLLAAQHPLVGFLGSAEYYYRKRADGSSTLQGSVQQPGRFTDVPEYGYLDVLRQSVEQLGHAPIWLQNMILYELSWYFSADDQPSNSQSAAVGQVATRFVELLGEIVSYLDAEVVRAFDVRRYKHVWRDVLLHGVTQDHWRTDYAVMQQYDQRNRTVKIACRWTGERPALEFFVRGRRVEPAHQKVRTHIYFDHALLFETVAWVPANGTLRIVIDGRSADLRTSWIDDQRVHYLRPRVIAAKFGVASVGGRRERLRNSVTQAARHPLRWVAADGMIRNRRLAAIRAIAASPPVRRRYRNAWVLMDRIHDANDSAEVLFRHLRGHRDDVNAWFVIERDTPDWDRLIADGFGDRLIAHGTTEWKLLMLNCSKLLSSHIDVPIHRPPAIVELGLPNWDFCFLQHGVIKDDLSGWLNPKRLALFVTSTPGEYSSIAGDLTPYVFTSKEVALTGLPRFDALIAAQRRRGGRAPEALIVAPTWRYWLNKPLAVGVQRRELVDDIEHTDFVEQWHGVVNHPHLSEMAETHGLRKLWLPHPNLAAASHLVGVDDSWGVGDYSDSGLHDLFADAAVLVTDYSSMAFNAAYLDRPVVYFQFDRDRVLGGGHVGRRGYFDYDRAGFGPTCLTVDDTVASVGEILERGRTIQPTYADRIEAAFPVRDGRCCERVAAAVEAI